MSTFNVAFRKGSDRPAIDNKKKNEASSSSSSTEDQPSAHVTKPDNKIGDALSCAWSFDTDLLCVGTSRGTVKLFHATTNFKPASFELSSALCRGEAMNSAISSIRFRPGPDRSTKDLVLIGCTDGTLSEWHLGSVQMVFADTITRDKDDEETFATPNEIYAVDYEPTTGDFFCSTGKNGRVKVYDSNRKANIATLRYSAVSDTYDAHSSRVQSCKWSPDDKNTIYTAGWDKTVQIWDIRAQRAVRRIFGPYVCGDGIDVFSGLVVTASTRSDQNLQFWDARNTDKPLCNVEYPISPATMDDPEPAPSPLFTAKFSPDGRYLATGGTTDFRIIDVKQTLHDKKVVRSVADPNAGGSEVVPASERRISVFEPTEVGTILTGGGVNASVFSVGWRPGNNTSCAAVGYGGSITVLNKFGGL